MSKHQYMDLFLTEEDQMAREMFRNYVEKEIMPVRQKIDDDTLSSCQTNWLKVDDNRSSSPQSLIFVVDG